MLLKDLRKQFYDPLVRKKDHVLILVNVDVDGICAARIFRHLLVADQVGFTMSAIESVSGLEQQIYAHIDTVTCIILINCGARYAFIDKLSPPRDVKFYILDSHRPIYLENVYDDRQVMVAVSSMYDNDLNIPRQDQIYLEESSSDEENESDSESETNSPTKKRSRKTLEERAEKIRKREKWKKERETLIWDYYDFSGHSGSTSIMMYDLANHVSKVTGDVLWWAIVGFTSQLVEGKMNSEAYSSEALGDIKRHVRRLNHVNRDENAISSDNVRILMESGLSLSMYRHWSIEESIRHSIEPMCQFQLWSQNGSRHLKAFLVDLGLPISQAKQKFTNLETSLMKDVLMSIAEKADKYDLRNLVYLNFMAQYAYTHRFSAYDTACAIAALIEMKKEGDLAANLLYALEALTYDNFERLYEGIDLYKKFLEAAVSEITATLNQHQIQPCSPYLLLTLNQGTAALKYLQDTHGVRTFGRFLLHAFISTPRGKRHEHKPLIIEVPVLSHNNEEQWYLIVGIPPVETEKNEARPKSFFGSAFERAATQGKCRMKQENFDVSIVMLRAEDRLRFQDALTSLMF